MPTAPGSSRDRTGGVDKHPAPAYEQGVSTAEPEVVLRRDDRVATITVNRPHDQNRLTRSVLLATQGMVDELAGDDHVQAVVVTGAGSAFFSMGMGGFPGVGGPVRLPALVGRARALELIGTGRQLDAAELERLGLVLAVHPGARLLPEARALSDTLRAALEWSHDVDEGMAAHREGRAPRFTGR